VCGVWAKERGTFRTRRHRQGGFSVRRERAAWSDEISERTQNHKSLPEEKEVGSGQSTSLANLFDKVKREKSQGHNLGRRGNIG